MFQTVQAPDATEWDKEVELYMGVWVSATRLARGGFVLHMMKPYLRVVSAADGICSFFSDSETFLNSRQGKREGLSFHSAIYSAELRPIVTSRAARDMFC
ncbi:uncharacterized protein MYCFIDRAFT_179473 [Pseudocercospora fijiensis CIRAD86]|uniref:Uncharacterized protein n=1 Tax=Pseudocercospora fijiensis (strain CIRAD86) TaxID=383855 RepID=M2YJU0_PSEFD|nr:uncharacterized protein MYCFIDRAFT_179473 [Pseudocercospora fijiensis CIRAD86]EME78025.1 hypothetical protein MYCFIDRAFT_179473 [Pseudocercospora fijiensis CIRAD86]